MTGSVSKEQTKKLNPSKLKPFIESGLELMWPSLDDKDKRFNRIIMYAKNPNHSEPLRLAFYVPKKFDKKFNSKLPAIVHFHQGGFFYGGLDVGGAESFIERLFGDLVGKQQLPCVVVDVDYRYPPHFKYPAAIEDAHTALRFVYDHAQLLGIDRHRLAVCGESSGAALASSLALISDVPIAAQLLLNPFLDLSPDGLQNDSARQFAQHYGLSTPFIEWAGELYHDGQASVYNRVDCSALKASDEQLMCVPPTLLITGDYDPLKSQSEIYAERLRKLDKIVELHTIRNTVHLTSMAMPELNHKLLASFVRKHLFFGLIAKL